MLPIQSRERIFVEPVNEGGGMAFHKVIICNIMDIVI